MLWFSQLSQIKHLLCSESEQSVKQGAKLMLHRDCLGLVALTMDGSNTEPGSCKMFGLNASFNKISSLFCAAFITVENVAVQAMGLTFNTCKRQSEKGSDSQWTFRVEGVKKWSRWNGEESSEESPDSQPETRNIPGSEELVNHRILLIC